MSLRETTEDTITSWLREELERKGVRIVETQIKLSKPQGGFIKPDIYMENGGRYVIQAKLGDSHKFVEAIGQVWDCIRYGGVDGGFVIIYPKKIVDVPLNEARRFAYRFESEAYAYFGPKDNRPSLYKRGGFDDMAKWISELVIKPPPLIEPNIGAAIRQLRKAADFLVIHFKHFKEEKLENIFGGRDAFDNILQYEEGKYPIEDMQRAIAYLLINQLLFYHILSRSDPDRYEELDEENIKHPKDLSYYFNKVLNVNYEATFGFDVASQLTENAVKELKVVIKNIKALTPEKIKHDLLGQLFHDIIPLEIRKKVGAFYTNIEASELLASIAIDDPNVEVADLAVGSGGLLVAAYRTIKRLLEEKGEKFTVKHHKRIVEKQLTGVDIMPFAAHLAAINLSLQAPLYETERVRIAVWDSMTLVPGMKIPSVAHILRNSYAKKTLDDFKGESNDEQKSRDTHIKAGVVSKGRIGGEQIQLKQVDIVIMNPPFTRQERLPEIYKNRLDNIFIKYKEYLKGQIGLHAYFIFLADRFLKSRGKIAFVLPATVLRVKSMAGVRKLLSLDYSIDYIITAWRRLAFSEATWVREILLIARKLEEKERYESSVCKIVTLKTIPRNLNESHKLATLIKQTTLDSSNAIYENDDVIISTVDKTELAANIENWYQFIATFDPRIRRIWKDIEVNYSTRMTKFSSIAKSMNLQVKRGIETRKSEHVPVQAMFIVSNETRLPRPSYHWLVNSVGEETIKVLNRASRKIVNIPLSSVTPSLATYSGVHTMHIRSPIDYVVIKGFEDIDFFLYDKKREQIKKLLHEWRQYVESRRGNLLVCRRFVPFAPNTHNICFYTDIPIAPSGMMWSMRSTSSRELSEDLKILTLWMNGTLHLAQLFVNRVHDIWIDVHEYVLNDFLVLNPQKLTKEEKTSLLELFKEISNIRFPSLAEQILNRFSWRKLLDMELFKILGVEKRAAEQKLETLYEGFTREFSALEALAKGKLSSE